MLAAQESGHKEVEETPKLEDVVLDGCTRQYEPVVSTDTLHGLRKLRPRVLDDMAFVKDAIVPVHWFQLRYVVPDHRIRGNDDVVRA